MKRARPKDEAKRADAEITAKRIEEQRNIVRTVAATTAAAQTIADRRAQKAAPSCSSYFLWSHLGYWTKVQ
jgi:hypothetical protein